MEFKQNIEGVTLEIMTPEKAMRDVVDACTDCDCCRYIMDTNCLFFPEIYRLWDREMETGEKISSAELRHLADLCNYCALCPCPNIREDIIKAKTLFIDRDGLGPCIRTLEDVERVGRLCGALPWLTNFLLQNRVSGGLIRQSLGIHPKRKMPKIARQSFPSWARARKLHVKPEGPQKRKVAYFAGCSARHIFPELPKAVVSVLRHNDIEVYYPSQQCCGMPAMLEGDRTLTLAMAGRTVARLAEVVDDGYDIICSCPTCGYMLRQVLKEGAYYSAAYQELIGGDSASLKIPIEEKPGRGRNKAPSFIPSQLKAEFGGHHMTRRKLQIDGQGEQAAEFMLLDKSVYGNIMQDNGYFSAIDPLMRLKVSGHTHDLGEYLMALHASGEFNTGFNALSGRTLYYPPCHQREQEIGMPYLELLAMVPGMRTEALRSSFYCCGMAGIMGFKRDFHTASLHIGSRLIAKIKEIAPDRLVTDCLSCRLQFNQTTPCEVSHPIEVLLRAYGG